MTKITLAGRGGLSKKSSVKRMSKIDSYANTSIVKKSNSWTMDEIQKFQLVMPDSTGWVGVWVAKSPQIINLQIDLNYLN